MTTDRARDINLNQINLVHSDTMILCAKNSLI